MNRIGFDPATADHATPQYRPGELFTQHGKIYRYVQAQDVGTIAISTGTVLRWANDVTEMDKVTADRSASLADSETKPAGVAVSTPTADYYFFMQVSGYHPAIKTNGDDDLAAGVRLMPEADGTVNTMAAGSEHLAFATTVAADVDGDNTVAAIIDGIL